MKIFREVNHPAYHYYIQNNGATVLWYPEMTWKSQDVEAARGRLLAEGESEHVLIQLRDALPPDLLSELKRHYSVRELLEGKCRNLLPQLTDYFFRQAFEQFVFCQVF